MWVVPWHNSNFRNLDFVFKFEVPGFCFLWCEDLYFLLFVWSRRHFLFDPWTFVVWFLWDWMRRCLCLTLLLEFRRGFSVFCLSLTFFGCHRPTDWIITCEMDREAYTYAFLKSGYYVSNSADAMICSYFVFCMLSLLLVCMVFEFLYLLLETYEHFSAFVIFWCWSRYGYLIEIL
jgi:hypothetical protein